MIFKSCLSPLQWTFARHVGGLWLAMAPQVDSEAYSFTNRVTLKLGTSQKWNPGRNPAKWIKAFFNFHRIWWIWLFSSYLSREFYRYQVLQEFFLIIGHWSLVRRLHLIICKWDAMNEGIPAIDISHFLVMLRCQWKVHRSASKFGFSEI